MDIPGLVLTEEFITPDEEKYLIEVIDSVPYDTSLSRRTQHYGYSYNYNTKAANEKTSPIPQWCYFLIKRLLDQKIIKEVPDQMIVNEYMPGQGIHPHVDNTSYFADGIVSISLGSPVVMDFIESYNPDNKKEVLLHSRSAVSLHGDARYKWRHGIASRKHDNGVKRTRRISLTFRKMK